MAKEHWPIFGFIAAMIVLSLCAVTVIVVKNNALIDYNAGLSPVECHIESVGWLWQNSQYCQVVSVVYHPVGDPVNDSVVTNLLLQSCFASLTTPASSTNQAEAVTTSNQTVPCYLLVQNDNNVLVLKLEVVNWADICIIILPLSLAAMIFIVWCCISQSKTTVTCWLGWHWSPDCFSRVEPQNTKLVDQATQSLLDDYIDADEDRNWGSQRLNQLEVTYRACNGDLESSSRTKNSQEV